MKKDKAVVKQKEKRDAILYVKVKDKNKSFMSSEAFKKGYKSVSEYVDKLIDSLRK